VGQVDSAHHLEHRADRELHRLGVRGGDPPRYPGCARTQNYGRLFIDGIRLFIVNLVYSIPIIIVSVTVFGASILLGSGQDPASAGSIVTVAPGSLLVLVLAVLVSLFELVGAVRLAGTGSMGEAFHLSAIREQIGRIGWGAFVIALVVLTVVLTVVAVVLGIIPILGWILLPVMAPAFAIFSARYVALPRDSAPARPDPPLSAPRIII